MDAQTWFEKLELLREKIEDAEATKTPGIFVSIRMRHLCQKK